jgi:hypothetical protein
MSQLVKEISDKGEDLRASHSSADIERAITKLEGKNTEYDQISANILKTMLK